MIFNGKQFADVLENKLQTRVAALSKKPKLVSILDNSNPGSVTYTNLKEQFAHRIGVEFERLETLNPDIQSLNSDATVNGIILQLPFPNSEELIKQIDINKDVDGLREDSKYTQAAVLAVSKILSANIEMLNKKICVVGSNGELGKRLMREFKCYGFDKDNFDLEVLKSSEIVISATGYAELIKPEMVRDGVVAIDLGFPKGDFSPKVAEKASFFTPVPGGVGPVTVACLFSNLLDSINV